MKHSLPADYYNRQYNARAQVVDHPAILARWARQSEQVRQTSLCQLDIAYGNAPEECLDLFPASMPGAPLLVFIHGGWWRSLDKSDFSFIAPCFTRAGINVALPNYTLAPAASLYDIVLQQVQALAWLYRNADRFGFDRTRITLAGHSAGAHLCAMLMAAIWPAFAEDLPPDLIKAGILISGVYDLEPVTQADFVNGDLRLSAPDVPQLSPAFMPQSHPTPFVTTTGGLESEEFQRQNQLLGTRWKASHLGDVKVPLADHFTICDEFATSGRPLFAICARLAATIR